jgi:cyanophycin synthetase
LSSKLAGRCEIFPIDGEDFPKPWTTEIFVKIHSFRTICGPNVYHQLPVIVMKVDLQNWADVPSSDIPHFLDNLLQYLPNLKTHTCSPGYAGGFIERFQKGTYMAHIIEHIGLELSVMGGIEVTYGKTRYAGQPGHYEIVTRFQNENGMISCLRNAVALAEAAATSQVFELEKALDEIRSESRRGLLGPSTEAIIEAAQKRGIPHRRLAQNSLIQLGYGKKSQRVQTAITDHTSLVAADIAQDKDLTKRILQDHFIPVPEGIIISSLAELQEAVRQLPPPYAIKPFDGHHGQGVSLNLHTWEDISLAFEFAKRFSESVLLEEMCQGLDYRILVINGKMVAAARRTPPYVKGNGADTVRQLIDRINADPRRGQGHDAVLTRIEVDDLLIVHLQKQNQTLDTVPAAGQIVVLRENANLSGGGTAEDVTDQIHPEIKELCERTARVAGLDICGIDLIHESPDSPVGPKTKVIEVNAGPGLRMHLSPCVGEPRPVGEHIIDMLYPQHDNGRIPILSITGTNGKTTVARMLHKIFSLNKQIHVGMTTTDGIWIGPQKIFSGDTTGPKSAQAVLADPKVDVAVLEVARGGLLRGGLAYDWSDISVVTNIRADHIGQDGIEDIEDLIWIKSLVAERVREGGTLVLNADDEPALNLRQNPRVRKGPREIFLFSNRADNPAIREQLSKGLSACWVEDGYVCIQHRTLKGPLFQISDIPLALNGLAEFQVSNITAAVAAGLAAGLPVPQIIEGLRSFQPAQENMGRLNVYRIDESYVILDYGHNQDAIESIGRMLEKIPGYAKTAVLSLPGDRHNNLIKNTGKSIQPYFDRFILKDDQDLRNRKAGEVAGILKEAIQMANPSRVCETIPDEIRAIQYAIESRLPHEIVTIFYEDLKSTLEVLQKYDPLPVSEIVHFEENLSDEESFRRTGKEDFHHSFSV